MTKRRLGRRGRLDVGQAMPKMRAGRGGNMELDPGRGDM